MNQKFTRMYKNLCSKLGENNDALYGVLTIAASKGVLRPTFTMMDKKQEKKSRLMLRDKKVESANLPW